MDSITADRPVTAALNVEKYIEDGLRLYEKQRVVVRDLESEQAMFRAQEADRFKRRADDLKAEESETLRRIDARQSEELAHARALLATLARLRGD